MKATEQYFPVVLFVMLLGDSNCLSHWTKSYRLNFQVKATNQSFPVVMFVLKHCAKWNWKFSAIFEFSWGTHTFKAATLIGLIFRKKKYRASLSHHTRNDKQRNEIPQGLTVNDAHPKQFPADTKLGAERNLSRFEGSHFQHRSDATSPRHKRHVGKCIFMHKNRVYPIYIVSVQTLFGRVSEHESRHKRNKKRAKEGQLK